MTDGEVEEFVEGCGSRCGSTAGYNTTPTPHHVTWLPSLLISNRVILGEREGGRERERERVK